MKILFIVLSRNVVIHLTVLSLTKRREFNWTNCLETYLISISDKL